MRFWLVTAVLGLVSFTLDDCLISAADDPPDDSNTTKPGSFAMPFNVPLKTTGGAQVWTDYRFRGGYRLQKHSLTGHWRVLDESDVRRAWGNREQCLDFIDGAQPASTVGQAPHYVILLHGLMRTNRSMAPLEKSFNEAGYENVVRFAYASTRSSIGDHSAALRELIEDLPADATFSFIGHSMGNIVVRHMVGDLQRDGDPHDVLRRSKSMVMLGPPNQGASIARRLAPTGLYGIVTGKGGLELGPKWSEFEEKLATPPFPFVIVAGDVSEKVVKNPLVDGAGDFVVSLEEAELEGREALHRVPVLHSFMMNDDAVIKICVDYVTAKDLNQR